MSNEYPDFLRVGEVYQKISNGEIPTEPDIKDTILDVFTAHGIETVNKTKYWTREHPVFFLGRMILMMEDIINSKQTAQGEEMGEAELDLYRKTRVRFYRILRAVKTLKKEEQTEEE